jgi:hypothetical protein
MPYILITLHENGSRSIERLKKQPTLEQLQKAVMGYIETVPYFTVLEDATTGRLSRGRAYCNENGLAEGFRFNQQATQAWHSCLKKRGPFSPLPTLTGPVVFYCTEPSGAVASDRNA